MVQELDVNELADANQLREILARVHNAGDQYILKENGQRRAALLSVEDLELFKRMQAARERAWDDFFENLDEIHALSPRFPVEEVEADVDAAIQEVRRAQ